MYAPSILVFSRDPGPTNSLIATLETLLAIPAGDEPPGLSELRRAAPWTIGNLKIFARAPGESLWRSAGFTASVWEGDGDFAAERLLSETGAGLVLTGTSDLDESGDRAIWRVARKRLIQSHVVLDHPANLAKRFVEQGGSIVWPDFLYVPDATFAGRLAEIGAPRERIRIVGELHHARLLRIANSRKPEEIAAVRKIWNAKPSDFIVLFASECAREMRVSGQTFSFDEVEEFELLSCCLARGEELNGLSIDPRKLTVIVRPHPRDRIDKYAGVIEKYGGQIHIEVSAEGSPDLALLAADLVVGMESSLLYEAAVLGRRVVSLIGHDLSEGKSFSNLRRKVPT